MSDLIRKFRLGGRPFIKAAVIFIGIYSLLHWVLYLKYYLIPVKEMVFLFWLPFLFAWLPVWIWVKPALRNFKFRRKDDPEFKLSALASFLIAIPAIIAQHYLETATGALTSLNSIYEYAKKPATRYFSIRRQFLDKHLMGVSYGTSVSGRHNNNYNMYVAVALPIFEKASDTVGTRKSEYWLIQKYSKTISNRKSNIEKGNEYERFKAESLADFDTLNLKNITYLQHIKNVDLLDTYERAVYSSSMQVPYRPVLFLFKTDPFEKRNGNKLYWFAGVFAFSIIVWFLIISFLSLKQKF